jgi:hypothetical protein
MKKIKNIIKTLAIALIAGAACVSCDLDLLPLNDVVLENFWKDKSDVDNVLRSCYYGMQSDYLTQVITWGEVRSDNTDMGEDVPDWLKQILKGNLKQTNKACDWAPLYTVINRCNTVLFYAPQVAEEDPNYTESDLRVTQAEARGLRALSYFYLIRAFRDVPFSFQPSIDDSQDYVIPASKHENILDSLILDIEECKDWAPRKYSIEQEEKNSGRITRCMLYSLLADLYLWKASNAELSQGEQAECYKKCVECADYVIDFKKQQYLIDEKGDLNRQMDTHVYNFYGYPLIAERSSSSTSTAPAAYNRIFGQGNSYESIFELTYGKSNSDLRNTAVGEMYGYNNSRGDYIQYLSCNTTVLNNPINNNAKNYNDQSLFSVTTDYRSLYNFGFQESGSYPIHKYVVREFRDERDFGRATTTWSAATGDVDPRRENELYNGWIIYRLSDVMLMRAEAEIELAGLQSQTVDWNTVIPSTLYREGTSLSTPEELYMDAFNIICAVYLRSNPYAQTQQTTSCPQLNSYTTYQSFVTLCENERRRELMFEGKRYFDLVRRARREGNTGHFASAVSVKFGEASKAVLIKMAMMDFMYMPYAEKQLDVNPNLKQNPAYVIDEDITKN